MAFLFFCGLASVSKVGRFVPRLAGSAVFLGFGITVAFALDLAGAPFDGFPDFAGLIPGSSLSCLAWESSIRIVRN